MSTFNSALSSVWTAAGSSINTITGVADLANGWVRKHQLIQKHTFLSEVETAISTKSLETDAQLQRNAEQRHSIDQSMVDQERARINSILAQL